MLDKYKRVSIAIILLLICGFAQGDRDIYFKMAQSIDVFGKVYREVSLNYVDPVDPEEFMKAGIEGMLGTLDPYTNFIDEESQDDIEIITNGKYGGIGATIGLRNKVVTVVDLIEGYSAQRQGIIIGDRILKINGIEVNDKNYNNISSLIKGEPGTETVLVVEREGMEQQLTFNLVREEIEIKNLAYYGFYPKESNNVYLKLTSFSRTAGEEIKNALFELKREREIKSIVLDLRGNPGGLLDAAINVSEKFLENNTLIVSVVGRDSTKIKKYFAKEKPLADDARLVVLVDRGSASASEIVAGALQDHDRGVIVGNKSFGKGLVQTVVPISRNTSLKITTAKYYTPSGRCIQKIDYSDHSIDSDENLRVDSINYYTDNRRIVKGAGGISPDSAIVNDSESKQVMNMIARGMFFKFATSYYNTTDSNIKSGISGNELFTKFMAYVDSNEFEYTSKVENLAKQLKKEAAQESYNGEISHRVDEILNEINIAKKKELNHYQQDILANIYEEIAARESGRKGRIEESLENDKQFAAAVNILNDKSVYNRLLKISE